MSDTAPTFADVCAAQERLRGIAHRTPVVTSHTLDEIAGAQIFLKCENFQRMGAFKFRGAYNRLAQLDATERSRGVVAFSSGNHAQGVALAAKLLGIPATIVMPSDAPASKVAATRGYGAEVISYDRATEDREAIARRVVEERGATLVPPYDDARIIAGAGTAALELLEDHLVDAIVSPVGGGGLLAGLALAAHGIDPQIAVYGVEPESGDDMAQSLHGGERVRIALPKTIADGLQTLTPGEVPFAIVREHVKDVVTVSDDELRVAMRLAFERLKIVIEPSGAAGLAAVISHKIPPSHKRIGVVVTGGNVDAAKFAAALGY